MYKHLTREQRYAIYLGIQKHETNKAIAQAIEVSESTVSREIKRNSTKNGKHLGGVLVYFTDSYSSWQKGAVENTNKLIRQYIPKGTNINTITDTLITKIQKKINRRPREKLNFSTPVKEFYKNYS